MTLRVALVLEGDAAGATRAAEQVKTKFDQMVAGIEAANRKAAQSATDTTSKFQAMVAGIDSANRKAAASMSAFAGQAKNSATQVRLNTMQMQNMTFQMNDMATMLASGQSPFVMMMQQGMQIAQIFGPGVGVAAALKAAGAAALAFATNPLTLAVLGLAVAAGAAKALWSAFSGSGEADAALERHAALVEEVKRKYVEAGGRAKDWVDQLERFTLLEAEGNLEAQQKQLQSLLSGGMGVAQVGGQSSLLMATVANAASLSGGAFGEQSRQLMDLNQAAIDGRMTIVEYRAAVDEFGRSTAFDTLRQAAMFLTVQSKEALEQYQKVLEAEQALRDKRGERRQPTAAELAAARGNIIGGLNALGSGRDFGAAFGDVNKEAERASKKQADELQRLADMWRDKAAPAVERYGRALGELEAAKGYFESEQEYMRARLFLQEEMNKAIEKERRERLAQATDFGSGLQRGLEDYARTAMNVAENIEQVSKRAFTGMEEALVGFVDTGKLSFSDLARSIISDLARISIRQGITGPLASGLSGVISSIFGGGAPMNLLPAGVNHGGYGPGDSMSTRMLPASVFANAPRHHAGIGPGERAAVLRDDESVLTPGQMRAMGGRGVTVKLELVTAQGAPVPARDGGRRTEGGIDVQRLVVGPIADDVANGGPLSRIFEQTYSLSRRTR